MSMRATFAVVVCAMAIGCFAADFWFLDFYGPRAIFAAALPLLSFGFVGSLLVVLRAGGPIGWLLGTTGALFELLLLLNAYGSTSVVAGAALPGGELAVWLGSFVWIPVLGLVVSAMILFPDGRPPGRAFAIILWIFLAFVVIGTVGAALADQPIAVARPLVGPHADDPPRSIPNPVALRGPVGDVLSLVASPIKSSPLWTLIAPAALAVRFRRSRGVEREQLKWLTYTAAIAFGLTLIPNVLPQGTIKVLAEASSVVGIGLLPVAIAIAVTRYRLYDIDVLIRRTLIYAAVSAVLLAAYVGGVALFQAILSPITSGSGIAVAISTLATVALFQPVRTRIQVAVDRRFYREKYDAERTLDAFSARLRQQIDLGALEGELLAVVDDTMRPAQAHVWLRKVAP